MRTPGNWLLEQSEEAHLVTAFPALSTTAEIRVDNDKTEE